MATHWTMVSGQPGSAVILVVTTAADQLRAIAERVGVTGGYVFCALPTEVERVFAVATIDLVVVLSDVGAADRARVVEVQASVGQTAQIADADDAQLLEVVTRLLSN